MIAAATIGLAVATGHFIRRQIRASDKAAKDQLEIARLLAKQQLFMQIPAEPESTSVPVRLEPTQELPLLK